MQFEGATKELEIQENFAKQYQQEKILDFITTSVLPLIIVLVFGTFALIILKSFVSKMPSAKRVEQQRAIQQQLQDIADGGTGEIEGDEPVAKVEFSRKEIKSQKDQSINELNEAVMASPEEAAKLLTSFIRD